MKIGQLLEQTMSWPGGLAQSARAAIALNVAQMTLPILFLATGFTTPPAIALAPEPQTETTPSAAVHCPPEDLSALVYQLMLDLPSYSNRVIQRASRLDNPAALYVMVAGQAEILPLSLEAIADAPHRSRLPVEDSGPFSEEIYQILFTTLERQYGRSLRQRAKTLPTPVSASVEQTINRAAPSFQQFHWLVLARQPQQTAAPWQIISLRSQLIPYPDAEELLAPARESRKGPVGKGLALWLRDWHSGAIQLNDTNPGSNAAHETEANLHCITP